MPPCPDFATPRFHARTAVDLSGFQLAQPDHVVLLFVSAGDGAVLQVLPAHQRAEPGCRDDLPASPRLAGGAGGAAATDAGREAPGGASGVADWARRDGGQPRS